VPRQYPNDSLISAETVDAISLAVMYSTSSLIVSNFALNIILTGALNQLWSLINGLQVITHLPVFHCQFPANANSLLRYLVEIANFELIP